MKDSGIAWIGEIPEHWEITKVKFLSSYIGSGTTPDSGIAEYYDGTNPWIQSGDLYKTSIISKTEKLVTDLAIKTFSALKIYKAPFVVIAMYGASVGNVSVSHINACVNQACCVIITRHKLNLMYLYYWLTVCKEDFDIYAIGGGQPNISQQVIKNQYLLKVPLPEQQAIASFLDTRCAEIDGIIADLEHQVDLLKEYKKSLITETVTKGLDKHVKLKDSGIAWIGKIPEHWEVKRTLYVLKQPLTDGPHTTPELYDEGIPFVSAEAISTGNGGINFENIRGYISKDFYEECCKKYIPRKNDIYIIKSGATTGTVSIVTTDDIFTIWSPLAVFRCDESKVLPYFMFYSLQSTSFQKQVQDGWTYGTQQNIGMRTLEHLKICIPPLTEQRSIADFLDTRCAEIDAIIKSKEKQIKQQKEYKKSLIYEYVTGKKRVKKVY